MKQKLLFVIFGDDPCKATHAAWYATQLASEGHEVAIILDGPALGLLNGLADSDAVHAVALKAAITAGLVAGACSGAAKGCGGQLEGAVEKSGLPLLAGMNGHASISKFIERGFHLTVF